MSKQEGRENGKDNGAIVLHEALTLGKASALTSWIVSTACVCVFFFPFSSFFLKWCYFYLSIGVTKLFFHAWNKKKKSFTLRMKLYFISPLMSILRLSFLTLAGEFFHHAARFWDRLAWPSPGSICSPHKTYLLVPRNKWRLLGSSIIWFACLKWDHQSNSRILLAITVIKNSRCRSTPRENLPAGFSWR